MQFSDFIVEKSIITQLEASGKESVIRQLVQGLVEAENIPASEIEPIIEALLKREELGTTGIGNGIAVPHAKHISVKRLVGAVGISPEGVAFDSLDKVDVHLFFLLVSPPDQPGEHLRALEHITRHLKDDSFVEALKDAESSKEVLQILYDADVPEGGKSIVAPEGNA